MQKISYALIGCGRIAVNHIAAALKNKDDIRITALCDIVSGNIERLMLKSGLSNEETEGIKRYTNYRDMIAKERLDLVAIATESGKHAQIAIDCMEKGINVIVEKPMALSIADADRMIECAKNNNVKLCACHQNRFNKSIQKIREALESGRFGRLFHGTAHIRWNRGEDYYRQAPWRGTWEQDGGVLMNQCIHNIDLLRWMMGDDIDEVFAYTDRLNHPYIQGEDLGMALVKFKNNSYGIIEGTTNIYPQNLEETLYIFGEKGTIKVGGKSVNIIEEWSFADGLDNPDDVKMQFAENPPNVYGFGHNPLYKDVIDSIRNDRNPYVDGHAGKRALELVLAIYKSAKEGQPVKLPLDDMDTLEMQGFFGA